MRAGKVKKLRIKWALAVESRIKALEIKQERIWDNMDTFYPGSSDYQFRDFKTSWINLKIALWKLVQ